MPDEPSGQMPEVTFSTFVISLASSALVHLGEVPNPETGTMTPDPQLAKHSIDTLAMLRKKTHEGLTPDEDKLLNSMLYEVQMKYIVHHGSKA